MDVLPAPVPLISPGKYLDCPEPRWRLRPPVHLHGCCDSRPVLRPLDMPFPSASRLVFKAWMPDTLPALQEYGKFLLGQGSFQPQWLVGCYPQPGFLAHSLRPECILRFDSHFESGNLNRAYALSNEEYDLYVSPDTNTRGHTQWFYFSVSHARPGVTVTFNIVNLSKGNSLLAHGLRPVCRVGNGPWVKVSGDVSFYRNGYERTYWHKSVSVEEAGQSEARKGWYYTLSFTHTFERSSEPVAFAFSPPYPLTRLVEFLDSLSSWAVLRKETLCSSSLGLDFPLVTLTAPKAQGRPLKLRPAIVFSARVHPGETPSSFLLEEIMRFLCCESEVSRQLLGLYVFHFIPMLNPDGVMLGNYRSCVEGVDLNRRWQSSDLEPLRSLRIHIQKVLNERKIALFCDLHAHAKKNNVFIYGCNTACDGGFTTWTKVRLFPRILARLSPYFNYEACKFRVQKGKVGTGRVVIWKDFGVTNSFTLETSFHAYRKGADLCEFEERDFAVLSANVLESVAKYSELLEQFEQEVGLNGGWLKPGKLKELTGIPAQQLALMEQEEQLRKERFRQARLSVLPVVPQSNARSASARTKRPLRPVEDFVGVQGGKRGKPKAKQGWRDYFTEEEVRTVLKRLKEGRDFEESESSGSDSQPSEGNFSENEDILQAETMEVEEEKTVLEEEEESAPPPLLSTPSPPLLILQSTSIVAQTLPTAPPDPPKPAKALHIPSPPVKLLSATQPLPDNVYVRPSVYPVSDISTILRSTHRGNASFDYSDFRRPRIHREARRAKRSSSPVFLIESYTAKREPQARTIKTLASTQRIGAGSGWSAYASKQGLAATTRNAAVRVSRRQLEGKWGRTNL